MIKQNKPNRAYTLIELIMVMTLAAIITAVFAMYISKAFEAWTFLSGQKSLLSRSQYSLQRIVKELKHVKNAYNLTSYTSSEVTFIDIKDASVTFSQSGEALYRNSDILLDDLQNPGGLTFTYLNENGLVTTTSQEIRSIRVKITAVEKNNKIVLQSSAKLRNTP